jgi:hypothetical protein
MNGRFQMQGGKNWFLLKEMNANRFFWDSHWLEIWSNHFYPSMGPNGGSVAMDSGASIVKTTFFSNIKLFIFLSQLSSLWFFEVFHILVCWGHGLDISYSRRLIYGSAQNLWYFTRNELVCISHCVHRSTCHSAVIAYVAYSTVVSIVRWHYRVMLPCMLQL